MKTKLFTLFVALLATTNLWAEFQYGNLYYETLSSNTAKVVGYIGNPTSVSIPTLIQSNGKQYTVTSIGYRAFADCSSLTSVTIGNSVTSIGELAFSDCSSLTSITIGNGVTSIGRRAFEGCFELTKTNYTGDIAGWCNIELGAYDANPMSYSNNFYINDQEIKDLVIPNTVNTIRNYAFYGCSALTSITIPNSVTSIGESAFDRCSSLSSVTIPNSVMSIGVWAFSHCRSLTSVTIGNSVKSIKARAFEYCSSLTSITIPNSVTNIGDYAFLSCSGLTSITIGNGVTSIGYDAFRSCSSLTSMVVEKGNTTYDSRENCNAIIETATNTLIAGCQNTIIPNSVTNIGDYAFSGRSGLTSITIPNSVTSIGNSAFVGCSSLTSVTIGNSVTSIGDDAFYNCSSLTSIVIPDSVTSIGGDAFMGCSSLASITIPNSVTSIGIWAFNGCSSLTIVICKAILVPSTGYDVFAKVPISSAVLYVPDESVDIYKYMYPWDGFGSILPISQLPTDVEDIQISSDKDASVKKVIRNGQVVILHNDKSYNIMGQEVE